MDSINAQQATAIAQAELAKDPKHDLVLLTDQTREYPFGWVFRYEPRRYLETRNPRDAVPGVGPLVVNRDGTVVPLSTSVPPNVAIDTYMRQWSASHPR